MKRKVFGFVFLLVPLVIIARPKLPTEEQVNLLFSSTTYVVVDENQLSLDGFLRKAVQQSWKITNYQFVTYAAYDTLRNTPNKVFLLITEATYELDSDKPNYKLLSMVLSDASGRLTTFTEYFSLPIAYDEHKALEKAIYIVEPLVKFAQQYLKDLRDNRLMFSVKGLNYYNRNNGDIRKFELIIDKSDLIDSLKQDNIFKKYYSDRYQIVDTDVYSKYINGTDDGKLFVYIVKPFEALNGHCIKYVINNSTGKLYYYDKITNAYRNECVINTDDLKKFGKTGIL